MLGSDVLSALASPGCEEFSSAVWWTPTRFLIMTTKGLIELEKRRPIELLMQVLEGGVPEQLHTFFQVLEDRLKALGCYLETTLLKSYGAGVSDNAAMVINKRRRLDHAAQQQEDDMTYGIRTLLFRVAEACALLRLLSAHNLGCLALRELGAGTADMAKLANTTLRELVEDEEGRNLASQLIRGLVNEQLDAGISSSRTPISMKVLVATVQAAAPSYFRQEDMAYLLAGGMLEDAEAATSGPERDVFIKQAVALFASMSTIVSFKLLNNKLAALKYYEGIVTLSLAVAA
ncbi:hypothetical protein Vretifemale_20752 [Volvox reticuliferus]|uniref:Nucleoporin Nup133/Nup155-like C-terminal domain-containing protein n=1 Tax=Volvox reticuliferus TaxID=1737510 RepID=A0A8J4D626_9CHLO|nr:hypothetical protein Vretifemale_20752 [Volvox reticuliferus]